MNNITEEMIDKYADTLLIGLTDEERKMIQEEFETIEKNMDFINQIPNIKEIEPRDPVILGLCSQQQFNAVISELEKNN